MRGEDDRRRRDLVEVADLEADDPVLDVVDDPDPVAAAELRGRSSSSTSPSALAVERDRRPRSKPTRTSSGSSGASSGRVTSWKTSSGGGSARSSIAPPSEERPQRLSSIEYGRRLGAALDRDPVLARVGDLLLAAHPPLAHRRDHLQLGIERRDRRLDPHLVVALAGAAVGDRVAAGGARVLDRELGDQRPPQRGEERIAAAVESVGPDRRQHVVARRTPRARRRRPRRPRPRSLALPVTTSQSSSGWPRLTVSVTISAS